MPAMSWPKRTQRVQWMQRVMSVETSGPRFLSFTTRLRSLKRDDVAAEAHREILQLALAALIADRAVERMIDEQEFHRRFLRGDGLRRLFVKIFMPSATGVAQAGIGFGAFSTSTRHMRQLAAMGSLSW